MKRRLLPLLACPECRSPLDLDGSSVAGGEVEDGTLACSLGDHRFPIRGGIPRFVEADRYVASFSLQRRLVREHFSYYRADRSGYEQFFTTTGFDRDSIRSGPILEVGCGYGRFLDVLSSEGVADVIGVDLSTDSIELAREFVGDRDNVHLVQCDLFALPFADGVFDRVFSIGVLHHTPDTRAALGSIVSRVAPGGELAVWVYPPEMKRTADVWRKVTTRIPPRLLYAWCIFNQIAFFWLRALPGGWRFSRIVPGAPPRRGTRFWLRVLSDFDNLSPTYAYSHEPAEVAGWFREFGLDEVREMARRSAVHGRRPAAAD